MKNKDTPPRKTNKKGDLKKEQKKGLQFFQITNKIRVVRIPGTIGLTDEIRPN